MIKRSILMLLAACSLCVFVTPAHAIGEDETPSGIKLTELESEIDGFIANYIGKTTPGAAITVVKNEEIIFSKGYGYADIAKKEAVDPKKTVFEYGSISKLFLWTAVMQLVEQGKLHLNEDIKAYLPEDFASKLKYEKTITMLDIMSHTAGFEEWYFDLMVSSPEDVGDLKEYLLKYQPKQVYEPGSTIAYSNYATALAGYIVEHISGHPFFDYEMNHIFTPALMKNTSGHPTLDDYPQLENEKAIGYIPIEKGQFKIGEWSYITLYPAGAVNGTAEDLARYAIALMSNDSNGSPLFEKTSTIENLFTQSYTLHEEISSVAHGFWEYDGKVRGYGHGGNTASFTSQMVVVPEEEFGVIILNNVGGEMELIPGLLKLLLGEHDVVLSVSTNNLPSSEEVIGRYTTARSSHSSFLEFFVYLTPLAIEAITENEIQINVFGMRADYTQISPYVYQITGNGATFLPEKIYFEMENGKVKRISHGEIEDYLPLEGDRTFTWLLVSLSIIIISLLYFVILPIGLFILWLLNRKKKLVIATNNLRERRIFLSYSLAGTIIGLNNIILLIRIFINQIPLFSEFKPHLIINLIMLVVVVIGIVAQIVNWKAGMLTAKQKSLRVITITILLLFLAVLANWNFFNIWI